MKRVAVLIALSLVTALAATGCSGDDGPSIVVYNAQHEQLLEEMAPKFTDKTGIEVEHPGLEAEGHPYVAVLAALAVGIVAHGTYGRVVRRSAGRSPESG